MLDTILSILGVIVLVGWLAVMFSGGAPQEYDGRGPDED